MENPNCGFNQKVANTTNFREHRKLEKAEKQYDKEAQRMGKGYSKEEVELKKQLRMLQMERAKSRQSMEQLKEFMTDLDRAEKEAQEADTSGCRTQSSLGISTKKAVDKLLLRNGREVTIDSRHSRPTHHNIANNLVRSKSKVATNPSTIGGVKWDGKASVIGMRHGLVSQTQERPSTSSGGLGGHGGPMRKNLIKASMPVFNIHKQPSVSDGLAWEGQSSMRQGLTRASMPVINTKGQNLVAGQRRGSMFADKGGMNLNSGRDRLTARSSMLKPTTDQDLALIKNIHETSFIKVQSSSKSKLRKSSDARINKSEVMSQKLQELERLGTLISQGEESLFNQDTLDRWFKLLDECKDLLNDVDQSLVDNHVLSTSKRIYKRQMVAVSGLLKQLPTFKAKTAQVLNPMEALQCHYLRLKPSVVRDLEQQCRDQGIDPGIHPHMTDDEVLAYFDRKAPQETQLVKQRS